MRVIFDIETDGLYFESTKVHVISIAPLEGSGKAIESFSDTDLPEIVGTIEDGLKRLSEASEISGHNIISFDIPVLKKLYNWTPNENTKITDTLVISRLLNPDRPRPANYTGKGGPHSLEAWGYRVGTPKPDHEDWSVFNTDMLRRNRSDVEINHSVYHLLESEQVGHNWSEAIELEHQVATILAQQEINGVAFNAELAHSLITDLNHRIQAIDDQLLPNLPRSYTLYGKPISEPFKVNGQYKKMVLDWYPACSSSNSFVGGPFSRLKVEEMNLGSMPQVKEYLLKEGWQPTEWNYDDEGNRSSPKLTEDSYGSIKGGIGRAIKDRLLFRHRRSQISGWIETIRSDGRITAGINSCGTNTGRGRHHGVVNVPKASVDVFYGHEMRSLFTSSEGRVLVGHDADGLELRMLAHYMNDPEFTKAVVSGRKEDGTDVHTMNMKAGGFKNRDQAKTFIYAFLYGAGNAEIAFRVGVTEDEAAILKKNFLAGMPTLAKLIKRVKAASKKGWLKGLDGRKVWMRSFNGQVQQHKALNTLLQSAGAIVMKKSMTILDSSLQRNINRSNTISPPILKVLDMHDEAQADVNIDYVDQYKELAVQSIVEAGEYFKLRCPLAAEAKVGKNWAETH